MITDATDHRPGTVPWIADEVRASAAGCTAGDDEVGRALHLISEQLAVEDLAPELARRILVDVVRGRKVERRLVSYVSTAVARQGVAALADRVQAPQAGRRRRPVEGEADEVLLRDQVAALRKLGECSHGEPGGDQLHPQSGRPLCALCRAGVREPA